MNAVADVAAIDQYSHDNHHFHINSFSYLDDTDTNRDEVSSNYIITTSIIILM